MEPCVSFGLALVGFCLFFLLDLFLKICFIFLSQSQNRLLQIGLNINHRRHTNNLNPFFKILIIKRQPINHISIIEVLRKQCLKMCQNFPQRHFVTILRRQQLFLNRRKIRFILNDLKPILAGQELRHSSLATPCHPMHQPVINRRVQITLKRFLTIGGDPQLIL